jgi:hypothetical protein
MWIMYLVQVIAIVGMLVYVTIARKRINQAVAEGKGPLMFHNSYAGYFDSLGPEEHIIALWQGLSYTGSGSGVAQIAGALLNQVSKSAIGVSKYTPMVFVALTSHGRLLVAEEFSELGDRGNYKEVRSFGPGARAVVGPAAIASHSGPAPKNPFSPAVPLELAALSGEGAQAFGCWLSSRSLEVTGRERSISAVLPIDPGQAAAIWQTANRPMVA